MESVLSATLEELGRVGYGALRIEDVAARSGVNKTTIYRRWVHKSELVAAAIERMSEEPVIDDLGSLRDDLRAMLGEFVARVDTARGRGIVRMLQTERADPEVAGIIRNLRARHQRARRVLFERALARGEIPAGSDVALLIELTMAPVIARVVHLEIEADPSFWQAHIDMIVAGARAGAAVRSR